MQRPLVSSALALLLGAALLALAACGVASPAAVRNTQKQTVEGMTIALESAAAPKMNDTQELIVTLTDASGAPVEGADVYLDLDMPAMPMGTNSPIATPGVNGTYRAQTAFTMTGDWSVTVVAEVGGQERRAAFTVAVLEQ